MVVREEKGEFLEAVAGRRGWGFPSPLHAEAVGAVRDVLLLQELHVCAAMLEGGLTAYPCCSTTMGIRLLQCGIHC